MSVPMILVAFMCYPYVSDMVECRIQRLKPLLDADGAIVLWIVPLGIVLVGMLLALPICIFIIALANIAFRPKIAVPVAASMSFFTMIYSFYQQTLPQNDRLTLGP
jgi:hypothetical protein